MPLFAGFCRSKVVHDFLDQRELCCAPVQIVITICVVELKLFAYLN